MLSNYACVRVSALFLFCCGASGSPLENYFKAGKPFTEEEFQLASRLKDHEEEYVDQSLETGFLEEDIINNQVTTLSFSIDNYLWPDAVVPYLLDKKYGDRERLLIAKAIQELQSKTCIRFVPKENQKDFIHIVSDKGCASYVGRLGGAQVVRLGRGCYTVGIMMHELMHTLGFIHEQSRTDRNDYVTVMWNNIKEGRKDNFKIWNWYTDRILKEKYDYSSILHYNRFAFSKDPKSKPTLEPKKENVDIGQRKFLSEGDVRKINKAYKCSIN